MSVVPRVRPPVLGALLRRVGTLADKNSGGGPGACTSNDVYSIAATINSDKKLDLVSDVQLMTGFESLARFEGLQPPLTPFQSGVIDSVVKKFAAMSGGTAGGGEDAGGDASSSALEAAGSRNPVASAVVEILDVFATAVKEFNESKRAHYNIRPVNAAIDRINVDNDLVKGLDAGQLVELLNAATTVHVKDYAFAIRLTRRAAELAKVMDVHQACICFARLNALGVADSFAALLHRIDGFQDKLQLGDCWRIIRGLESAPAANMQATALLSTVLFLLEKRLTELQQWQHVVIFDVCARYDQRGAVTTGSLLRLLAAGSDEEADPAKGLSDRELASVLNSARSLKLLDLDECRCCRQLFTRAEALVHTMQLSFVEPFLDIASTAPIATDSFLEKLMLRITADAGNLQTAHLVGIIDVLCSYPPASGSPTSIALGTAAAMRSESFERDPLIRVVLGLAEMKYVGDDLALLLERLAVDRNGFRTSDQYFELLDFLTPASVAKRRMQDVLAALVHHLLPAFAPQDHDTLRQGMARLRLDERALVGRQTTMRRHLEEATRDRRWVEQQALADAGFRSDGSRVPGRAEPSGAAKKKKKKDEPFNFKKAMWDME